VSGGDSRDQHYDQGILFTDAYGQNSCTAGRALNK
jgi:hypothetical protein